MSFRFLLIFILFFGLAGCGASSDFTDLQSFMEEVRARPKGEIEPLPKFQMYENFTYGAASLRSPFQPPVTLELIAKQKGGEDVRPDEARTKQFLEGFNIEVFDMVGVLSNSSGFFALISGAGGVHRVKVGDYLGRNHGRIQALDESRIEVIEIVPDGEGGWLERPRSLSLKERS